MVNADFVLFKVSEMLFTQYEKSFGMKLLCFLVLIVLVSASNGYSQDINLFKDGNCIPSGQLTSKDGQVIRFTSLRLNGDNFILNGGNNKDFKINQSEVYKITKNGSYAGYGALGGALTGLLICLTISANDIQSNHDPSGNMPEHIKPSFRGWVLITGASTGIGALFGTCFTKKIVYFENNSIVHIYPSVDLDNTKITPLLTVEVNM
jgi:hypothetical protein